MLLSCWIFFFLIFFKYHCNICIRIYQNDDRSRNLELLNLVIRFPLTKSVFG